MEHLRWRHRQAPVRIKLHRNCTQSANTMPSGVWGENTLPTLSGGTHAPPLSSASVTFPINTLGVTNGTSMSNTIIDIVNQTSTFATTL
ncbi:unnamed protein product, partial [Rotaria socialis]